MRRGATRPIADGARGSSRSRGVIEDLLELLVRGERDALQPELDGERRFSFEGERPRIGGVHLRRLPVELERLTRVAGERARRG